MSPSGLTWRAVDTKHRIVKGGFVEQMSEPKKEGGSAPTKKLNTTQVILIVGVGLVLAAIIAVGAVFLLRGNNTTTVTGSAATPGTGNIVLDENNVADAIAEIDRKAAEGNFDVKMNVGWSFPNGTSPSKDAYVANSETNRRPMYFEVSLKDTEEVIYTSPVLELGQAVKEFSLSKDLEPGTYDCICAYKTLLEDQTVDKTILVAVTITVEG